MQSWPALWESQCTHLCDIYFRDNQSTAKVSLLWRQNMVWTRGHWEVLACLPNHINFLLADDGNANILTFSLYFKVVIHDKMQIPLGEVNEMATINHVHFGWLGFGPSLIWFHEDGGKTGRWTGSRWVCRHGDRLNVISLCYLPSFPLLPVISRTDLTATVFKNVKTKGSISV